MFAIIKCFHLQKKKRVTSDDLYNVNLDIYEYSPFKPASADDFKKRAYYGRIEGEYMILVYILFLSGKLYSYHAIFPFNDLWPSVRRMKQPPVNG